MLPFSVSKVVLAKVFVVSAPVEIQFGRLFSSVLLKSELFEEATNIPKLVVPDVLISLAINVLLFAEVAKCIP